MWNRLAITVLAFSAPLAAANASSQNDFFQNTIAINVIAPGRADFLPAGAAGTAIGVVKSVTVYCELDHASGASAVFVRLFTPLATKDQAFVVIPTSLIMSDDTAPTSIRYFSGRIDTAITVPQGFMWTAAVTSNLNATGSCYLSVYGNYLGSLHAVKRRPAARERARV